MDDEITADNSNVGLYTRTGLYCRDYTVLQGQLAALVTWDLTSEHVATVGGTAAADFMSCGGYEDWVELMETGSVARMRLIGHALEDVTGEEVKFEYRVKKKGYCCF